MLPYISPSLVFPCPEPRTCFHGANPIFVRHSYKQDDSQELDIVLSELDYVDLAALLEPTAQQSVAEPSPLSDMWVFPGSVFGSAGDAATTSISSPTWSLNAGNVFDLDLSYSGMAVPDGHLVRLDLHGFAPSCESQLDGDKSRLDLASHLHPLYPLYTSPDTSASPLAHSPALDALLGLSRSLSANSFSGSLDAYSTEADHSSTDSLSETAHSPAYAGDDDTPRDLLSSLTDKEREILLNQGLDLAAPLTKQHEKKIRQERRKIRNKESAKESRRKKAEYMAGLEKRAEETTQLKQRCDRLESENVSLVQKLVQLQAYIVDMTRTLPGSTSLPLFMLLATFCFAFTPSVLSGPDGRGLLNNMDPIVKSRVLLAVPDNVCPDKMAGSPRRRSALLPDQYSWLADDLVAEEENTTRILLEGAAFNDEVDATDPINDTVWLASNADYVVAHDAASAGIYAAAHPPQTVHALLREST